MRELALFAGAGGGLLGSLLLGWSTVCAVEIDPYCRSVLLARQRDGHLDQFPVWDDIRTFDGVPWRGFVDVISGGFPCQPFSTASRGRANAEDLWPEMLRVVTDVRPRFVFAENVQAAPIARASIDLQDCGYGVLATKLGTAQVGAPHNRPRWWLLAHAHGEGELLRAVDGEVASLQGASGRLWPVPGSSVLGNDDGVANRMDRLRAIGNGQVPAVAALAWTILKGMIS